MNLREIIGDIATLDTDLTIYLDKNSEWSSSSSAIVAEEPEDGGLPNEAKGMEYFLEIDIANEVLDVWSNWRNGQEPSLEEKCEAIIYYAKNDAYLPVIEK